MKLIRISIVSGILCAILLAMASCASTPEAKSARFIERGKKLLQSGDASRAILEFRNATKATPKSAEAHYELGEAYLAASDVTSAVLQFKRAVDLNPKHVAARLALAKLQSDASNPEIVKYAQDELRSLLQENPDDPNVLHALALTEMKLGQSAEAVQHLDQAISAAPRELLIAATLAEVKLRQKDLPGAEDVLKKACANSPKSADCVVLEGRLYAAEGKAQDAEQKYRQALSMDSKHAAALQNLAMLQISTGRNADAEQTLRRLSDLPAKQFHTYHATFLFQQGKRDEAVKELEALSKADPGDRGVRTSLVAAYQAVNRTDDAQRVLDNAIKKNKNDLDALLQRGEINLGRGRYSDAEMDLSAVLHLRPDAAEVHYVMAHLHRARGESLQEQQELNEALRLSPSFLEARLEMASDLINSGSAQAGLDLLDRAPGNQLHLLPVIEVRNVGLISTRRFAEAEKGVAEGLGLSRSEDLLVQDAALKIQSKHYEDARRSATEALGKSPEDLRALRLLVFTFSAEGHQSQGVSAVQEYARQHPKSAAVQYFLGTLLAEAGDKDQAKQVLAAASSMDPSYTPSALALAQIDLKQGQWDAARQPLNAVLSKSEDPLARRWLGMLEASVGNQAAAIADFQRAVALNPKDASCLNNLAYLMIENGKDSEEALKYAEKAVELAPEKGEYQDTLGWVLYHRGIYSSAINHIQMAVANGGGAVAQYHLAMAYFKAGDTSRGRAILKVARSKNPNLPEARVADQLSAQVEKQ